MSPPRPFLLAALLSASALVLALLADGDPVTQAQLAARWTARASFGIFLVVYVASSLVRVQPAGWNRALIRSRRQWGLAFAFAHTVHLAALITYFRLSDTSPPMASLVFGGFGYIVLYAMAATSSWSAVQRLGHIWRLLHRGIALQYLWLVFALSYAKRAVSEDQQITGIVGLTLALLALALRVAAHVVTRSRAPVSIDR